MKEEQVENRSLLDLARIIREAGKLGVRLVLIGGYAVRAYTYGYRYTKDIDLVADKPAIGRLKGILNTLGYSIRDTEFGIAGSKRVNEDFIDLHISVGKIHDISTGKDYLVDPTLFRNAKRLKVKGYYSKTSLKAPVVDLDTLLLLKLMPVGRQKDAVDVLSLLLDRRGEINLVSLAEKGERSGLKGHLLDRSREYASRLRKGELDKIWFNVTASRLPHVEKLEIAKFFAKLASFLRIPTRNGASRQE